MNILRYKKYLYVVGLFLLLSIAGLWSWNTLAELFDGPHAQYKHVLAALGLLVMTKWILMPHGANFRRGKHHIQRTRGHAK